MNKLLEAIEEYQTQKGLNDSRFSQLIGIDFSTLSKVKSGHRRPGGKVLTALMQIPELRPVVSAYMVGTGTTTPQHPPSRKRLTPAVFCKTCEFAIRVLGIKSRS